METIFDLKTKPLVFKFGYFSNIDQIGNKDPVPALVAQINELIEIHSTIDTFIFSGWEVIESTQQLYDRFPNADFLIPQINYSSEGLEKYYQVMKNAPGQPLFPPDKLHQEMIRIADSQSAKLSLFIKDKEYETIGSKFTELGNYPLYYIKKRNADE
jgi:hypothetical protein